MMKRELGIARCGLACCHSAQVKKALENTIATFTAYDNGQAVGMVRLIGDGGMSFYIKDFAVTPTCQSQS